MDIQVTTIKSVLPYHSDDRFRLFSEDTRIVFNTLSLRFIEALNPVDHTDPKEFNFIRSTDVIARFPQKIPKIWRIRKTIQFKNWIEITSPCRKKIGAVFRKRTIEI